MSGNKKGLLIVFEGTDGTGKSTQLDLLRNALQDKGTPVLSTCEPTNGRYGQEIRTLYTDRKKLSLEEELDLFIADRKEHVETLIGPALENGEIILCDRYYLSTIAYQGAAGLDPSYIMSRNSFAPEPDLALLFHAPVQTGVKRITENRGEALNDFENEEYLQKVAMQFDQMNFAFIKRIDASRSIQTIHQDILNLTQPLLKTL